MAMILGDEREVFERYDVPMPYFGPAPAAVLQGLTALDDVEVHAISCSRKPLTAPTQLSDSLFFHSVTVPRWGYLKTLYVPTILRLRRLLKLISPDIVHGQGTERYYGLAAAFSGFPSLITIHGNMRAVARALSKPLFSFYGLTAKLEEVAVRRCDGVLCLTRYTQQAVANLARRTWIVPNAVDAQFFNISHRPESPPRFLCVGLVCCYKNQCALIRALDRLAAKIPFRLVFAGDLSGDKEATEFQQLLSTRPWCQHLGRIDTATLQRELAAATGLIHPSLEDNCPMAILEAMAAGLPVIASTCGGIPDLVTPEQTGILCNPVEMHRFAEAVERLLSDGSLARRFGANGRLRAEAEFKPILIARRHLEIYRELAENN